MKEKDGLKYHKRIADVEEEIEQFEYRRFTVIHNLTQVQAQSQKDLDLIQEAILTRKGEIIGLRRLIEEEKDGSNPS